MSYFNEYLPEGSGPCAKQIVTATIVTLDGNIYVGTNYCETPQSSCPRGHLPSGVGYEMCTDICHQPGHAEIMALKYAGENAKGATLYLEGHTRACDPCQNACNASGIKEIIVGSPPRINLDK